MKNIGTRRHLVLSKDKTRLISVKVLNNQIDTVEGDITGLEHCLMAGTHWLISQQMCKAAGFKVIPDQWVAPHISVTTQPGIDNSEETWYHISVKAKHPIAGTLTVSASGKDQSIAKSNFWTKWTAMSSGTGAHTHLHTDMGYKIS